MSDLIISVKDLCKKYKRGSMRNTQTLRDLLAENFQATKEKLFSSKKEAKSPKKNLDKEFFALQDVSFDLRKGEVLGIVGDNGSGKSTLLKILSRITKPTSGSSRLVGRVASLLEVGTGFHPELTGRENVFMNGTILGMKRKEIVRCFDEIVDFAGIEKFIDTPVKHYSSGMFVRLGFSIAAHLEPEILIVDEVLAVGDVSFQKRCLGKLEAISESGRTVIFVSHNLTAVKNLCTRAILLEKGKLLSDASPSSVIQNYLHKDQVDQPAFVQWAKDKRPSNSSLCINRLRLLNKEGEESATVSLSEPLLLAIDYEITQDGASAAFGLVLFSAEGDCIFGSFNNHEKDYYGKPLKRGSYTTSCEIYGNFFNEGSYSLSINASLANRSEMFVLEHVLSFSAVDDGFLRADYHGGYGGCIRPKLAWHTELKRAEYQVKQGETLSV